MSMSVMAVASRFEILASSACFGEVLLPLRAGDLVDVREHLLQDAVLLEQLGGGLVADPRDAGDVVGGVALEPDQVGDQLRRHPVALDHPVAVVDLRVGHPARGRHHPHPVLDQLVDVAVAGDDHHLDPLLAGALRQRGDHVVGLVAVDLDVGEAERLGQRHQVRPLLLEQVRPRLPLGLVRLVGELAPRPARVPADDDGGRDRGRSASSRTSRRARRSRWSAGRRGWRSTRAARRRRGRRASCRRSGRARRPASRPSTPSRRPSSARWRARLHHRSDPRRPNIRSRCPRAPNTASPCGSSSTPARSRWASSPRKLRRREARWSPSI